jgi:hypothetical protein
LLHYVSRLHLQLPSTTEIEPIRLTYTPFRIRDGPSDDRVVINGGVSVKGDARGDFLVRRTTKQEQKAFDSVHVFMVIRQALTYVVVRTLLVRYIFLPHHD